MFLYFFFEVVSGFEVTRRILVDLDGISLRRKWLAGLEPENVHMMIGKLTAADYRKEILFNFSQLSINT